MKAIILAAGRGSRMGSLTAQAPKCLTLLGGRTLLDWQLFSLRTAGVSKIAVVRGYLGEMLARPGLDHFENPRWQQTNMVRSLQSASTWLATEPCVISYSDIVYAPETVSALAGSSWDLAISYDPNWLELWSRRFEDPLSDAETFRKSASGQLMEIGAKTTRTTDIQGQYMGLLKMTPAGWRQIDRFLASLPPERIDKLDMTSLLSGLLQSGARIGTVPASGGWYEVDKESDLALYEEEIEHGTSWLLPLLDRKAS